MSMCRDWRRDVAKWHLNTGKSAHPRDPELFVDIRMANGWEVHGVRAGHFRWDIQGGSGDILFARQSAVKERSVEKNWK